MPLDYSLFVSRRVRDPFPILNTIGASKINLWHAVTGISGEAGQLLDCIKKHVVYAQPLNRENAIEELGDLEFCMEAMRQELGVSRDAILQANIAKLEKLFPIEYTDQGAKEWRDKE